MTFTTITQQAGRSPFRQPTATAPADFLLRVVDIGLCGVICVAPFLFGGRHDFGRLALLTIIAITAAAWFIRQSLAPRAEWTHTAAHGLILASVAMLLMQLAPLPTVWLRVLSPRTSQLLPLWTEDDTASGFGEWNTISLMPHETAKSLAMLAGYGLLFLVVIGRVQTLTDVRRLVRVIGVASALMAGFSLIQFFTSDGRFFWFYEHPSRSAQTQLCGSFINRNHFAGFLVLGVAPLAAWLMASPASQVNSRRTNRSNAFSHTTKWLVAGALALVVCAVLGSLSRGGAVALLTAATVFASISWWCGLVDRRWLHAVGGLALAVVGVLSMYGYDQVVERLDDFAEGSIDALDQADGRRQVWTSNAAAVKAGWLAGSGAGTHAEICPVYLKESHTLEYTHAECGYLQIATENGIGGVALLVVGLMLCCSWCRNCLRHSTSPTEVLMCAACAAGLAASAVHSVVDFVWYIPACMSVTIVLAGCMLRLAQFAMSTADLPEPVHPPIWPRSQWRQAAIVTVLLGVWSVHTFVGPGIAAIYWDRYLRASVANREATRQQMSNRMSQGQVAPEMMSEAHSNRMLRLLNQVAAWDPHFARAQLRLAAAYIGQFETRQLQGENSMNLSQIQAAALTSQFAGSAELRDWLHRAFGTNAEFLYRADAAARRAAHLCPLQGEAYVFLGELCFLHGDNRRAPDALFDQALRVRPHQGDVLYEVGEQRLLIGDLAGALDLWQECFVDLGPHQMKIVYLLAGRIPAPMFLDRYSPTWNTLREIWTRYRLIGQPEDLSHLLAYALAAAEKETSGEHGLQPMLVWYSLAGMNTDAGRPDEALQCLQRAHAYNPRHFGVRFALAHAFLNAGRYSDAEPHVRWCLARQPQQKGLREALVTIAKQRMIARGAMEQDVRHASFNRPN